MSWFGSASLGTKYIVVLFSLFFIVITAAFIKRGYNKVQLRKFEKKIAQEAAEAKNPFRDPREGPLEEGDLFGVRAIEAGFYGGVAQSQPSSRAASVRKSFESSSWSNINLNAGASSVHPISNRPRQGSSLTPRDPKTEHRTPQTLHYIPTQPTPAKSPLGRVALTAESDSPSVPQIEITDVQARSVPQKGRTAQDSHRQDTQQRDFVRFSFEDPVSNGTPSIEPGYPIATQNLPRKPAPSYIGPSMKPYRPQGNKLQPFTYSGDHDQWPLLLRSQSEESNSARSSFDSWQAGQNRKGLSQISMGSFYSTDSPHISKFDNMHNAEHVSNGKPLTSAQISVVGQFDTGDMESLTYPHEPAWSNADSDTRSNPDPFNDSKYRIAHSGHSSVSSISPFDERDDPLASAGASVNVPATRNITGSQGVGSGAVGRPRVRVPSTLFDSPPSHGSAMPKPLWLSKSDEREKPLIKEPHESAAELAATEADRSPERKMPAWMRVEELRTER